MSDTQLPRLAKDRLSRYLSPVSLSNVRKRTPRTASRYWQRSYEYRGKAVVHTHEKGVDRFTTTVAGLHVMASTYEYIQELIDEALDGSALF